MNFTILRGHWYKTLSLAGIPTSIPAIGSMPRSLTTDSQMHNIYTEQWLALKLNKNIVVMQKVAADKILGGP